ncbi:hypothetical protein [Spirosoma koreense]
MIISLYTVLSLLGSAVWPNRSAIENFMHFFLNREITNSRVKVFDKTFSLYSPRWNHIKSKVEKEIGKIDKMDTVTTNQTKEIIPISTKVNYSKKVDQHTILLMKPVFNPKDSTVIAGILSQGSTVVVLYKFSKGKWYTVKSLYSELGS